MKTQYILGTLAVSLTLAVRAASAAAPDFWLPYAATPASSASGAKSGLFLIASNAVGGTTAPAPQWVTDSPPTLLGAAFQGFVNETTLPSSATPAALIYAAKGSDGNQHLYGLDLANPTASATAPKPVQITSLSVPPSKSLCGGGQLQTKLTTPSTLAVVVYVATPESGSKPGTEGYCTGAPGGKYYLITYGESATTAPTAIDIPGGTATFSALENDGNFTPLDLDSGDLGGLLYWDSVTKEERLYNSSFTTATTLKTGITGTPLACVDNPAVAGGARDYLAGSALATVNTSAGFQSYQFVPTGEVVEFFDGQAGGCITDPDNLYFIGTRNGSTVSTIYQASLSSLSTPKTLLTGLSDSSTAGYSLIGANGSAVVFQKYAVSSTGAESTTIEMVPVGVTSGKATLLGGPYAGAVITSFIAPAGGGSITGLDWLMLTNLDETVSGTTVKMTYASEVLDPNASGTVMTVPANTAFQSFGPFTTELVGNVLEITGITDTDGAFGGASLELLAVGTSSAPVKLTLNGGGSYKVPTGYQLSANGFYGTSVAAGGMFSVKGGVSMGLALDAVKHVIVPLSFSDTNVMPML
jgi:hypothetical protein